MDADTLTEKLRRICQFALDELGEDVAQPLPDRDPNWNVGQRNGIATLLMSTGYSENYDQLRPYALEGGIGRVRLPFKRKNIWNGTELADNHAFPQLSRMKAQIDGFLADGVHVVLDDHSYSPYHDPDLQAFWCAFGQWLEANYPGDDRIGLELQNESGGGSWDANLGTSVKTLVTAIREAGIKYPVAVGWGGWNSVNKWKDAFSLFRSQAGELHSIDPLDKLIFTAHYYQTTSGNDQPKAGKQYPEISGDKLNYRFAEFFGECRREGLYCMMTEVGMGGNWERWLSNGSGAPAFDGKQWLLDYIDLSATYTDVLLGTFAWGGGGGWKDDYPFRIESGKNHWPETYANNIWPKLKLFWAIG